MPTNCFQNFPQHSFIPREKVVYFLLFPRGGQKHSTGQGSALEPTAVPGTEQEVPIMLVSRVGIMDECESLFCGLDKDYSSLALLRLEVWMFRDMEGILLLVQVTREMICKKEEMLLLGCF